MFTKNLCTVITGCALSLTLAACDTQDTVTPSESLAEAMDDSLIEHARKHSDIRYVCPMHPQIVQDEPGNCPICGMRLEEQVVQTESTESGPPIVTIRPETVQNMGVRIAAAERGTLQKHIETVGYVAYDEDRMAHLHPRASGWVEKLEVRAEGDPVKRGDVLFHLYSPEIVAAQEEYLLTLNGIATAGLRTPGRDLQQSARKRLRLLEIPQSVMDEISRVRKVRETVPVLAPASGVVTKLGLREGMYVKPDMELYTISDVSSVWVQVDVFEHHLQSVKTGLPAEIRVAALPDRIWQGEVDYIYPELDAKTRTLKVRLRFANSDGLLKPNMLAQVVIHGTPKQAALHIPRDALIVTGGEERVILALGDGRFQPKAVVSGMRAKDRVEILQGLEENDSVVVSGQFLIDSESNLQASFRRMRSTDASPAAAGGMTHAH